MTSDRHPTRHRSLAVLFSVLMMTSLFATAAVAAPESETNDTAASADALVLGEATTGSLADSSDVDVFAFQATRGDQLNATLTVDGASSGNVDVRIYDDDGGSLGTFPFGEITVPGQTELIGDTVERTGTYYARLSGGPAEYDLTVTADRQEGAEPNEDAGNATPYVLGTTLDRQLGLGDVDVYRFEATRGDQLNATVTVGPRGNNVELTVYEADGDSFGDVVVSEITVANETELSGATLERTGSYYAAFTASTGLDGAAGYTFDLTADRQEGAEPNEDAGNATPYVLGTTLDRQLGLGDVDVYRFEATRGDQLNATVTVGPRGNNVELTVYEADGDSFGDVVVSEITVANETELSGATLERTGGYYAAFTASTGLDGAAGYTFAVTAARQEFTEPNDRVADATAFLPNPKPRAVLGIGEEDYYAFEADAGETVVVNASTAATRPGNLRIRAYEDDAGGLGTEVVDFVLTPGEAGGDSFQAARSGTYYVTATDARGGYALGATVDGAAIGVPNDRFESNENPTEADANGPLAVGRYEELRIVDADVDVFAVALAAGEELNAGVQFADGGDLSASIVDASGTTLANGSATPTGAEATFVAPSNGTYYVRVVGNGTGTTDYALTLRVPLSVGLAPSPARLSASPNATATVDVAVSGADLGVSSYGFDLAVDPAVATITDVEPLALAGAGDTAVTVAPDGAGASVAVSNVSLSTNDDTPLVTVTLATGPGDGESTLALANGSVADGVGGSYAVSTTNGTVVVSSGPGNVGGGAPARDLDDDGTFEDVDGSGTFDFLDVIALLFSIDRIVGDGLGDFFDFNGRSGFDFLDVVELLFSVP